MNKKFLLLSFIVLSSNAEASFWSKKAEGWHYYEQQPKKEIIEDKKQENKENTELEIDYSKEIQNIQVELKKRLDKAIISPTESNVREYVKYQQFVINKSHTFSKNWQKVVLAHPELDETLKHPVNHVGRGVYLQQQKALKNEIIANLAKEYGLFFFFKNSCNYCHAFAPIVKNFAEKHKWAVLPISLDGGVLKEFPNSKQDNGMAESLNIANVPALIAYRASDNKLIPIAFGVTSETEIEDNILLLAGEEYASDTLHNSGSALDSYN
ncbi:MAG: conjugal transfer protein TraF [Sphingobacteriia bacterium]|nr:conjugal transfer protein TraF [Sphingobacteriia bacterium]